VSHRLPNEVPVDRQAFSVVTLAEADRVDQEYWRSRTPEERLEALELSRQITYGYDPSTRGLSRFFDVAEFPQNKLKAGRLKDLNDAQRLS
jgi:hypothetical protein